MQKVATKLNDLLPSQWSFQSGRLIYNMDEEDYGDQFLKNVLGFSSNLIRLWKFAPQLHKIPTKRELKKFANTAVKFKNALEQHPNLVTSYLAQSNDHLAQKDALIQTRELERIMKIIVSKAGTLPQIPDNSDILPRPSRKDGLPHSHVRYACKFLENTFREQFGKPLHPTIGTIVTVSLDLDQEVDGPLAKEYCRQQ